MKKKLLSYASILVALFAFAACDDGAEDVKQFSDRDASYKNLTVTAAMPSQRGFGAVSTFAANDILRVNFVNSAGQKVGRQQTLLCEKADGGTATFSGRNIAVPNAATTMLLYWDNPANSINYDNKPVVDDLASQDGTEDFIRKHTCLAASAPVGESANITLAHKTALVKLTVQFPDDADAPSLTNTKITLKQKDGSSSLINKACVELAEAVTSSEPGASEFGDIEVSPTSVDAQAKTATAYALVWPSSAGFKDVTVGATIDNSAFSGLFTASAIQPGQANAVTSTVDFDSREYDLWMDDAAHTITDVLGNFVDGPKWMALANGTITIEANTSGSVRKGTMTLDNGRKYTITQIGPADFMGEWDLYSKRFDPNKYYGGSEGANVTTVNFGAPLKAETLTDEDGSVYTNNIGVKGLYFNTIMSGTVAIDYDAHTVKVGFMVDAREPQPTGQTANPYAVYLPETTSGLSWGGYNFSPLDFSATGYAWIWFKLSGDMRTLQYNFLPDGQKIGKYYVCGLSIAKATSSDPASIVHGNSVYDLIYQANYNGSNSEGMKFVKK